MSSLPDIAREAGIIGAGGAGFPTHVKLAAAVDTVIVNGAECEPLMAGDQYLMENRAGEIVSTLRAVAAFIAQRSGKPVRSVIAVKKKYKEALAALSGRIKNSGAEILELDNVYPAGDEQFLVYEATGRIVPEGGIPLAVNVVVMNVGTLVNLADAISGRPVTHRVITVGGAVANPMVIRVPIGTAFPEIIARAGVTVDDYILLVNGPMMGRVTTDLSGVVNKTTGGLFVLPKGHPHVARMTRPLSTEIRIGKSACEACRYCTDFCPRYLLGHKLEPHKIMRVVNYDKDLDTDTITAAWLCCECGVCDLWACPMALSPRVFFREFKRRLKEAGIGNPHKRTDISADYYRQYRGVPAERLLTRLGLAEYDRKPAFYDGPWNVSQVTINLNQHVGEPSAPVVSKGDRVEQGRLIAEIPEGKLGARYHASISGMVAEVTPQWIRIEA
ncbi:MAG: 4Fe-4S dicluster domain-containing protein [Nitrospinae bacterium]|nr:4Fe-4S dicluster domain-containing protein [Nitrospinota bacterium]